MIIIINFIIIIITISISTIITIITILKSSTLFYAVGEVYRIELYEDEMKTGLFAYERWSRCAMSTFLDTKRDGKNAKQERIGENYLWSMIYDL